MTDHYSKFIQNDVRFCSFGGGGGGRERVERIRMLKVQMASLTSIVQTRKIIAGDISTYCNIHLLLKLVTVYDSSNQFANYHWG